MADGTWRIRHHGYGYSEPIEVVEIPVAAGNPHVDVNNPIGVRVYWENGKTAIYPWHSIVSAEHTPHTP